MSERPTRAIQSHGDRGFTLIELLIVVTMIGFLGATLAGVFSVILRTVPDADARITDARSLKGLVTWIPQDMDATPPTGFDHRQDAWPCAAPAPLDSYNVIAMSWTEVADATTTFSVSYRYELRNSEWVIARYSCQNAGTASHVNMTSELAAWDPLSPPAWVEMCSTPIDGATGDCPVANLVSDPLTQPVESMKVNITLLDGSLYTIDAAAKNPDENLADDPDAVTNYPPTAGVTNLPITMIAGETRVLDLYASHAIADPEGKFLTSAVDSYEPMPAGIGVTASDPLKVTIVADPSIGVGPLQPVWLIVSDAYGGSIDVTVTIEIVLPPNAPPVAPSSPYTLRISEGETIVLPLDQSHLVSDPNGDDLTLQVVSWPAPVVNEPAVGGALGALEMSVTVKPVVVLGPVAERIVTRVTDSRGASILVETIVEIVPIPPTNTAPVVNPFANPAAIMLPGATSTLTVSATDPEGDIIWAAVDGPLPAGLTVTTSGLVVTVTADPSIVPNTYVVPLRVYDWSGASTPISANVAIVPPPPPPPSPCALGGLTSNANPVGRSGTGGGPRTLVQDVLVTLTYSGGCDGLVLKYDTGHPSGLGSGVGRVFPSGSPTTVELRGDASGGSEKWAQGDHVLTVSTTSAVTPNSVSITLTVS